MTTDAHLQTQLEAQRQLVDVDHFDITVRELVRMAAEGEIRRAAVYQRKFRWDESKESRLIESVLLGLPIPPLFMAANADGTWEVVDGLQRLSTLMHFIASEGQPTLAAIDKTSPLVLQGLEKLPAFEGRRHDDLPTPLQLALGKRGLRVTALSDKSDLQVRYEVFERLNTGGVELTAQEVRACIFQGPFVEFLREMGDDSAFKTLVKLQQAHQHDGTREELVLKFFAYLDDRASFDGAVGKFLTRYAEKATKDFDIDSGTSLFRAVVGGLLSITKGPFKRKGYGPTPLVQLESAMVAAGELIRSGRTLNQPPQDWQNDTEWLASSTKGTNTAAMLKRRIDRAMALLS